MNVATQRLSISKQPNFWKPQQREMKPWGEVSSFRGANTLFEGQQINIHTHTHTHTYIHTHRRETWERHTEERSKERPETQMKEDPSSRSKEEPGPLRDTTSEGPSTL
jgi:hypothetical protein